MLVEVRPIDKTPWHGNKGQQSFTRPKTIEVLYDAKIGGYATGLDYLSKEGKKEIEHFQKHFPNDRLDNRFNQDEPHPFWSSSRFVLSLPNHTKLFDTEVPLSALHVKMMRASKLVANSLEELRDNKWPEAIFVIFNEHQAIEERAKHVELKKKAMLLSMDMSPEEKRDIILIMSEASVRNQNENFITVELDRIVTEQTEEFVRMMSLDKEEMRGQALILEAVRRNIIQKEASSYYYMGDKLGYDMNSTLNYLNEPDNQRLKLKILETLEN